MKDRTPDRALTFPDFTLVTASAGAGKTTALTLRYLSLLLADTAPASTGLGNILAITFTNNAALEMKQRILEYLKRAAFADEWVLRQLREVTPIDARSLGERCGRLIDRILDNYSDFQVQTIDSFLTRILRASALEYGLTPEFRIALDSDAMLEEAFGLLALEITADPAKRALLAELVGLLNEMQGDDARFIWDPYRKLADEVKRIYTLLSSHVAEPVGRSESGSIRDLRQEILSLICTVGGIAEEKGLAMSVNYARIVASARRSSFIDIEGKALDQKVLTKPKKGTEGKLFEEASRRISSLQAEIARKKSAYDSAKARSHYTPYIRAYSLLREAIEAVKKKRGEVFLGEANKKLAQTLSRSYVPEIYFTLGEQIYHYLIDEFQDTSPIQWAALYPLIEESLSKRGSLFLVGDTKQAIYTFRGGDWQIMARMLAREPFPSVKSRQVPLSVNYRSGGFLVEYTRRVFQEIVPRQIDPAVADMSGLVSYEQAADRDLKGRGYATTVSIDAPAERGFDDTKARETVLATIRDCRARHYAYGDIALLTHRNDDVVKISGWLNEADPSIPFLSHSSLDIRTRKITGEILALLKFLDSPVDDLSFAAFLLGEVFREILERNGNSVDIPSFLFSYRRLPDSSRTLYVVLRDRYPEIWERYFARLFSSVGYLPMYDLVAEALRVFDVFRLHPDEEASLVKLLEVLREVERTGVSGLKDFLRYAREGSDESEWNIPATPGEDAVTVTNIHKAKGMGYPVVILVLYDSAPQRNTEYVDEDEEGTKLLYLKKDWAGGSEALSQKYEQKRNRNLVDDLNRLYVALTRARREMYVVVVHSRRFHEPSRYLPPGGTTAGEHWAPDTSAPRGRSHAAGVVFPAPALEPSGGPFADETAPEKFAWEQTKRGEVIHAALAHLEFVGGGEERETESAARRAVEESPGFITRSELAAALNRFVRTEGVRGFFSPREGRKVFTEREIVADDGLLYRLDRLIVDPERVTVVDFKTGGESPDHPAQVQRYMGILSRIYHGRPVCGFLAYVDLLMTREVPWAP